MRRRANLMLLAVVLAIVATGCKVVVQTYGPTDVASIDKAVLTADGNDNYVFTSTPANMAVSAPDTNGSSNLRELFWPDDSPAVADSQSCATWSAATNPVLQQGAALRIVQSGSHVRAITVTKNIFGGASYIFNFHVWDNTQSPAFTQFGATNLQSLLVQNGVLVPLPWHFCARVIGSTVEFKVWTGSESEPAWGDASHGGQATLPAGWSAPGETGWYIGHLHPKDSATFTDLATYKYVDSAATQSP
jgi:hypothetical protein